MDRKSPSLNSFLMLNSVIQYRQPLGGWSEVEPPVPIPNTEVKRLSADDTEGATLCGKYATARRLY